MEFTARITREDFICFQRLATERINALSAMKTKVTLFSAVYWGLLAAFAVTLLYQYENVNDVERTRLIIAATIFAFWIAVSTAWQRYYFVQFCKKGADESGTVIGTWHFKANEDGINEENDYCSSFFSWECFKSVEEDQHNLYLFTDRLKAIIVPKSQAGEENAAKLKEYVTNRLPPSAST